ncbi:thioredoxin reductase 1, cytoplasmic-like [Zalophus californianus]|uniref:Thioredoxin reductase 1, cytoplasmic-like n=1 Tax=Zalophus californianus TaxID=9704 RepID=A0A6P9FHE7_ZALCA|nr:thioredoxin reductase 1, cytoplasmic-like [Zalophus californianus]
MGCAKSKKVEAAACPQPKGNGHSGQGSPSPAKDHLPSQPLPENPATGVSGPSGPSSPSISDPRAQLRAYIDNHPVVIFSKSTCKRCAEVKKLFKSMHVPYFLLELDQAAFVFHLTFQDGGPNLSYRLKEELKEDLSFPFKNIS